MNKSHSFKRIISFILAILIVAAFIPSVEVNAASKKGWVTKKGYKYYYNEEGKLQTGFVEIKGSTYYFAPSKMTAKVDGKKVTIAPKGAMLKGWYKIKKKYYYFDRSNGKMAVNKTVDSIKVDKKGVAKKSSFNKQKIEVMISARETMQSVSKVTDSKAKKREKCFDYVVKKFIFTSVNVKLNGKNQLIHLEEIRNRKDWDLLFAGFGFEKKHGDCVCFAATLAYMLHECGYDKVYIVDDKIESGYDPNSPAHAWVEIDGKVFDSYFAKAKGKDGNYNTGYEYNSTGSYTDWPINKKEISSGKVSKVKY